MDIRAAEISSILKDQIAGFGTEADETDQKHGNEKTRRTGARENKDINATE